MVQCAFLDLKEAEFGWQSELVTTKKCEFSQGKTNDSIVFAQHGDEIAVCAPIGLIRAILMTICLKYYCLLLFGEHQGGPQRRFWGPKRLRRHKGPSTVPPFFLRKTEVLCVLGAKYTKERRESLRERFGRIRRRFWGLYA